jgi:hypothetical protein
MEIQYLPGTLQIDLFGRGKNTYHWAGEADVFEAIEFAKRAYKVDPERMTLRGFSMGRAGVWHTALHHPDLWAAVEVGAGDNTSHRIPVLNTLPPYYQAMCRIFDNMFEWALNAYNIPFTSYVGENDRSNVKHASAREQLVRDGIKFEGDPLSLKATNAPSMIFLVAANTGHAMHPEHRKLMNAWLYDRIKEGRQIISGAESRSQSAWPRQTKSSIAMSCSSNPLVVTDTSRALSVVVHRGVISASAWARSAIRQGPSRSAMEEGTARTAGRMNSRTSDSEMLEPLLNIHLCARRSGWECIAFPNSIFADSHSRHGRLSGPYGGCALRYRVVAVGTRPPKLFARRDRHCYERFDGHVTSNRPQVYAF